MTEDESSRLCHMAFISLVLGIFVLVCSAVIAGTLLSTAFNDTISAEELEKALSMYEDLGDIMFALGDELVSSVDVISSEDKIDVGKMIVAQRITNKAFRKVKENLHHRWMQSASYIIEETEERKAIFRHHIAYNEPLSAIQTYIDLSQWIFQNCLELDYANTLMSQVATYIIFIKGMSERFAELSLGTLYVKTDIPVDGPELLGLRVGSKETMKTAFNFVPQARSNLEELHTHAQNVTYMVVEDLLESQSLRQNNEFSLVYIEAVKEETSGLFLAKQILYSTLHSMVKDLSDKSERKLYFNMTIVIISVAALVLCLIFSVISRATAQRQSETTASREIIYRHI